jgi:Fe-S-cluster-containing hydrogenase component 2/thioredoxin reductase/CRP-like cAMP-binding protein
MSGWGDLASMADASGIYDIAIVGSGPAGLSAAARAAEHDRREGRTSPSHVLLEGHAVYAKTIQRYQKGKFVMDEPGFLDLRSPMRFRAGSREAILERWGRDLESLGVNLRCHAEVMGISGGKGDFRLQLKDGSELRARHVVLAIGLEGNPQKLGAPGEDEGLVQYTLDDPDEYQGETIMVVGAGDSAIENAIALAKQNAVIIVNRREEFSRAKEGNLNAILAAINNRSVDLQCAYRSSVHSIEPRGAEGTGLVRLKTPDGVKEYRCHRVIARLGGVPPRKFVERCGVAFPSERPDALPTLSGSYESSVAGLYIVGSLAGYPLIKQAMNQGQDVVDTIRGLPVEPVDHALLKLQFAALPYAASVDEILTLYQQRIPMFRRMNALAFRELVIESRVILGAGDAAILNEARAKSAQAAAQRSQAQIAAQRERLARLQAEGEAISESERAPPPEPKATQVMAAGDYLFRSGEYSSSFFTIVEGEVEIVSEDGSKRFQLGPGQFFGEMSLLSGRPRRGSARIGAETILIETPRRTMLKLMNSNDEVRAGIDWVFVVRALQQHFATGLAMTELRDIALRAGQHSFAAGETIYREGESGDCLHIIRSGTVALFRRSGEAEAAVGHAHSGELVGQLALMGDPVRRETARAAVMVETISLKGPEFIALLKKDPKAIDRLRATTTAQLREVSTLASQREGGHVMAFLMNEGLGEATNAFIIDETLCVGCDNCEKACAETHGGLSRVNRSAGNSYASVHVPISCRHCEKPHCMKDCPVDAIHRAASGEVFIDHSCIGCGNCAGNCPYEAIRMAYEPPKKPGLLSWLLLGLGAGPGEDEHAKPTDQAKAKGAKAVKCDACRGVKGGPACVRACPTGAAVRVGPERFAELIARR